MSNGLKHQDGYRPSDNTILELEAESVAYLVASHFGMDGLASPNYVSLHVADSDLIMEHLEQIRDTASEMIWSIEASE